MLRGYSIGPVLFPETNKTTLTKSDVSAIDQQLDRAQRFLRHSHALGKARAASETVAQLDHSLHVCDTMIGLSKSPNQADHWRSMHRQVSEPIDEAGFIC